MRKLIIAMLAALAFVACEKDYQMVVEKEELANVVKDNKVSLKQALVYAENSIDGINPTTRSKKREVKSTEIYVAKPATRSAENVEVSFYLINYEDNDGFAMVSTDSRTTPVYAYSDEGNLTAEDLETNPLYTIFLDGAVPYYEYQIANYEDPLPIEIPDTLDHGRIIMVDDVPCYINTDTLQISASAFTTTLWHQEPPYNACLDNPNYAAGCAPVAAAQIMAYHEWPLSYNGYMFDYGLMKSVPYSISETPAAMSAARLIEQIGRKAETQYRPLRDEMGSSTYDVNLKDTFKSFGYQCSDIVDFSTSIIKMEIEALRPLWIAGYPKTAASNGHSWVIDAYQNTYKLIKYYYADPPYALYKVEREDMSMYYRCNMGYYGIDYAPYLLSSGFYGYNYNNKMIYNIKPNN